MRRRCAYFVGGVLAAGLVLAGIGVRFGPAVSLSVALAIPATEAWFAPLLQDAVRSDVTVAAAGRPLHADLYRPAKPRAGLLLVHGLSPAGRRHPELTRLAGLLARRGQIVLVPEFEGLAAFRLSGSEVQEIRAALRHLATLSRSVAVAGFSFGAGPALLAAADVPDVRLVGSFGGYADLRNVIAYVTTGVHSFGGRHSVQRQEEYNRWKLLALLVGFVERDGDRQLLRVIAERKLANPSQDTGDIERQLGSEGRSVMALVVNRREEALGARLAALSPGAREALDRLSPLSAVPRLSGRLLIAHGAADDSIPFTESLRLAQAAGGRAPVAILHSFHHTGPQSFWQSLRERARDGWNLLRLADALLGGGM